ncbi:MAG: hypothetical protein U0840_02000 [Gemmataceae bacterium]
MKGGMLMVALAVLGSLAGVAGGKEKARVLEVTKATPKLDVSVSQIGYRDTLLFYTFADKQAVLKLQIGNKDKTFPMTGTVYLFAESVKEEDLKKWLNNQHSDGLFPEVPVPTSTLAVPAKACKVTSNKFVEHTKQPLAGAFDTYTVTFEVTGFSPKKGIEVKGFTGTTKVHVQAK